MTQFYTHTQSVANTTWTITHNMGAYPVVDVVITDGSSQKIHPSSVVHTSLNVTTITFTTARSGTAHLVGA